MTIQQAKMSKCILLDNDNYRDWLVDERRNDCVSLCLLVCSLTHACSLLLVLWASNSVFCAASREMEACGTPSHRSGRSIQKRGSRRNRRLLLTQRPKAYGTPSWRSFTPIQKKRSSNSKKKFASTPTAPSVTRGVGHIGSGGRYPWGSAGTALDTQGSLL